MNNTTAMHDSFFEDDEKVCQILQLQADIMERIGSIQELVKDAVMNREWTDFESMIHTLNEYGDQFQELETERSVTFDKIKEIYEEDDSFYGITARAPEEKRRKVTGLYRNLKSKTMQVKVSNETLTNYLDSAQTTVDSFFDAACPDRKNRFYSRQGSKVPVDMRSMVINQSL